MKNFKYEILFDEDGIPYVVMPDDYKDRIEDKFMIIHLSCSLLETIYEKNKNTHGYDPEKTLEKAVVFLSGISHELGDMLKRGSPSSEIDLGWDVMVDKVKDRNDLPNYNIIYNDKIFERKTGLRVFVKSTKKVYELKDGITNKHWEESEKEK